MKANELMIGDWVKIKGHLDYDKVQEIARDENMQWYISFACSATLFRAYEFEPIPLTPEILEKNEEVKGLTMFRKNEQGMDCLALIYVPILNLYYVHEMQRALRLCGLNELADNFKM